MKRIWDFSKRGVGGGAPGAPTQAPPPPPPQPGQYLPQPASGEMPPPQVGPEVDNGADDMPERYLARPIRPVAQLAVRVGLWAAVILGAAGGIRALVFPGGDSGEPVVSDVGLAGEVVPTAVAGVAENAVQVWMTAAPDDQDLLNEVFVDPPTTEDLDNGDVTLVDMRPVAGELIEDGTIEVDGASTQDGYWTVTVAVDLILTDPEQPPPEDDASTSEDEGPQVVTWYVEVGIVGDSLGGMAALTTPAIVPAPPQVETQWEPDLGEAYQPDEEDELGQTIEGFLTALMTGNGDVSRYLSPDSDPISAANPAPFSELEVLEVAWMELDESDIRAWAQAQVTTSTGGTRVVAYEVVVRERRDRYEVLQVWGSPTVRPRGGDTEPGTVDAEGSTTSSTEPSDGSSDTSTDDGSTSEDGGTEPEGSSPPDESGESGEGSESSDTTDTTIELPAE